MFRADATYDDGKIEFHVGCSSTTNIDGNTDVQGITVVGFELCDPAIDDWRAATRRTARLIVEFGLRNPGLTSLREFRKTASLAEAQKVWRGILYDRFSKLEFPLTEDEANRFFENDAAGGHIRQLQLSQNTYVVMAAYMNDEVSVEFGISKETVWAGSSLTKEQRESMKYLTEIAFLRRKGTGVPLSRP